MDDQLPLFYGYYPTVAKDDPQNRSRQSVSCFNGLQACQTKYVCIIRSDIILNNSFLIEPTQIELHNDLAIFSKKIAISDTHTINPMNTNDMLLFHISDWLYFGETVDLRNMFKFATTPIDLDARPEQYIFVNSLKHMGFVIDWKNDRTYSDYLRDLSYQLMRINFDVIPANTKQTFTMAKYPSLRSYG